MRYERHPETDRHERRTDRCPRRAPGNRLSHCSAISGPKHDDEHPGADRLPVVAARITSRSVVRAVAPSDRAMSSPEPAFVAGFVGFSGDYERMFVYDWRGIPPVWSSCERSLMSSRRPTLWVRAARRSGRVVAGDGATRGAVRAAGRGARHLGRVVGRRFTFCGGLAGREPSGRVRVRRTVE